MVPVSRQVTKKNSLLHGFPPQCRLWCEWKDPSTDWLTAFARKKNKATVRNSYSQKRQRRWNLSFIVVGGGFSGVEVAGEVNELVRGSTRFYRNFRKEDVTVRLVHTRAVILPEVARSLGEFARRKMEKAGIDVILNTRAVAATREGAAQ